MSIRTKPNHTKEAPSISWKAQRASEFAWGLMRRFFNQGGVLEKIHQLSEETGLSPGRMKALQQLHSDRFVSMRELARALGCDPSYVTGLVDDLVERHLAERQDHPKDRRVKMVVLTGEGVRIAEHIDAVFCEPPESFGALTESETRQLGDLLAKLTLP